MLTKPGIVGGNAITAVAGFAVGSFGHPINVARDYAMLLGLSLVVAGACAVNNYLDRDIDSNMQRTQRRPLVQGTVSAPAALTFGVLLLLAGLLTLAWFTNWVAAAVALTGFVTYTAVYTPSKRKTAYSTIIGSVPGAVPPVVGYAAARGHLDIPALALFLFMAFWQIPHFYAIGIMRLKDYRSAHLPIWPITHGIPSTKRQMFLFMGAFTGTALALPLLGYTSKIVLVLAVILCGQWLWLGWQGLSRTDDPQWARAMFTRSLAVLVLLCVAMSLVPI